MISRIPPNLRQLTSLIQSSKKIQDARQQTVNKLSSQIPRNLNENSQKLNQHSYSKGQSKTSGMANIEKKHLFSSDATKIRDD